VREKSKKGGRRVIRKLTICADGPSARPKFVPYELMIRLNSSIAFYKTLMGIRSVTAASEHSLHLEYDTPNQSPVTLMLDFEMGTRALIGAEVSYRVGIW